jgi:hypothetical protein
VSGNITEKSELVELAWSQRVTSEVVDDKSGKFGCFKKMRVFA